MPTSMTTTRYGTSAISPTAAVPTAWRKSSDGFMAAQSISCAAISTEGQLSRYLGPRYSIMLRPLSMDECWFCSIMSCTNGIDPTMDLCVCMVTVTVVWRQRLLLATSAWMRGISGRSLWTRSSNGWDRASGRLSCRRLRDHIPAGPGICVHIAVPQPVHDRACVADTRGSRANAFGRREPIA